MSERESLRTWGIIIAILVVSGLFTALWPALTSLGGGARTAVPVVTPATELNLPFSLPLVAAEGVLRLTSLQALGVIAFLVIGAVATGGIVLAFLYRFLSTQAAAAAESEAVKTAQAALDKRETERIKTMRAGRNPNPQPSHKMPRWSAISTALSIIMFVAFFGYLISDTFFPAGQVVSGENIVNATMLVVGGLVLLTLPLLVWRIRPQRVMAAEQTDNGAIPWDFIVILISGLLVVGLGIGLMVYFNVPT